LQNGEYYAQNNYQKSNVELSSGKKSFVGRSDFIPLKNYEYTGN